MMTDHLNLTTAHDRRSKSCERGLHYCPGVICARRHPDLDIKFFWEVRWSSNML